MNVVRITPEPTVSWERCGQTTVDVQRAVGGVVQELVLDAETMLLFDTDAAEKGLPYNGLATGIVHTAMAFTRRTWTGFAIRGDAVVVGISPNGGETSCPQQFTSRYVPSVMEVRSTDVLEPTTISPLDHPTVQIRVTGQRH